MYRKQARRVCGLTHTVPAIAIYCLGGAAICPQINSISSRHSLEGDRVPAEDFGCHVLLYTIISWWDSQGMRVRYLDGSEQIRPRICS